MIMKIATLFSTVSAALTIGKVLAVGIPLLGVAVWGWGAWQYREGRVYEREEVRKAAVRDAQQWADWLVQMAVEDEAFAKAWEQARRADIEAQKGIDSEIAKAPARGVCMSADFLRELDQLRP